ncbi:MAG: 6-phosphofructokinase [Phycisphaeraceae bacterium]|nr:6-phosphofructokinase [Phycisphaeraceae bacterium]
MARRKRIGILTGGGDVPGLNSVIKSVVYRATEPQFDFEVVGIRRGWEGLTHADGNAENDPYSMMLDRANTRNIDRTGGTFLHTSRTNPSRMPVHAFPERLRDRVESLDAVGDGLIDATPLVLENLDRLNIDHLVAIGGDDTLSYAWVLDRKSVDIVAVPKTMDNDVRGTEYCIGFSTAMTRAVDSINRLRTTLGSHERIGVFRIFGRDAGFTALYAAYVSSTRCCIPESRFGIEKLANVLVNDKRQNPSSYALVLLSEGATWSDEMNLEYGEPDPFGHRPKMSNAEKFATEMRAMCGESSTVVDLTYELRSGEPDFLDKMVGTSFAAMAFDCIVEGARGRMMAVQNGCYVDAPIPDPGLGPRVVDIEAMYDVERFRPNYKSKKSMSIFMMRA